MPRHRRIAVLAFLSSSVAVSVLQGCSGGVAVGGGGAGGPDATADDAGSHVAAPDASVDDASDDGAADAGLVVVTATQIIDDMWGPAPDGPGLFQSAWYTYSDRTVSWSLPPIFISDAGGLSPDETSPFLPNDDGAGPVGDAGPLPYRRVSGGGEVTWGIGFGLDFIDEFPDGQDFPMNHCEAGAVYDVVDSGFPVVPQPFDASAWTGVQLWVKSFRGDSQVVGMRVDDDRTTPLALPEDGGVCAVCTGGCDDGFYRKITFTPEWTHVQVPFAAMHPQGYSALPTSWTPHTDRLYTLHFEIQGSGVPPFDVGVAYVELYR